VSNSPLGTSPAPGMVALSGVPSDATATVAMAMRVAANTGAGAKRGGMALTCVLAGAACVLARGSGDERGGGEHTKSTQQTRD
jgi:hypothetical protein